MTGTEIVREIMDDRRYTQQKLSELAGYKRQTNVSELLRSNNMRIDHFVRMIEAMDCEVIVKSKKAAVCENDQSKTYFPEWRVTTSAPTPVSSQP